MRGNARGQTLVLFGTNAALGVEDFDPFARRSEIFVDCLPSMLILDRNNEPSPVTVR